MAPTLENYLMRRLGIKYGAARSLALLNRVLLGMEKDEPPTLELQRECLRFYGVLPADYDDPEHVQQADPSECSLLQTRAEILVSIQRPVAEIVNSYEEIIGPKEQEQQQEEQDLAKQQSQDCTAETFEETSSSSEESFSGWTSKESGIDSSEDEYYSIETSPVLGEEEKLLKKEDDVSLPDNHDVDESSCLEESHSEALPNTELCGIDDVGESSCLEESHSEALSNTELCGIDDGAQKKDEALLFPDKHIFELSFSDDSCEKSDPELRGINDLQLRRVNLQRRVMVLAYQERYGPIQERIEQEGHEAPLEVKRNIEKGLDVTEDLTESDAAADEGEAIRVESRKVTVVDSKLMVKELKEQRARKEELQNKENKLDEILARFQKASSERIVDERVSQRAAARELSFFESLLATIENGGDGTDASDLGTSTSTFIKNCSLAVPPASAHAAMDCKEIVMAALYFLSSAPSPPNADESDTHADASTHTTGSTNLLWLLPLIRPQQMTWDLEKIAYHKAGDWKLVEIESQVAALEQVFCTVAKSMHGLAGSAFVPA
jgi:hypothetical protein